MVDKFMTYTCAIMAAQSIMLHYALMGFHCSLSTSAMTKGSYVELAIFHDSLVSIIPPQGYLYSSVKEWSSEGVYWTKFEFRY